MSAFENREIANEAARDVARASNWDPLPIGDDPYRLLFANSLDALILSDDEGNFLEVNLPTCDLFGCSREQVLEKHFRDIAPPASPGAEEEYEQYLQTGRRSGEFIVTRPDNEARIVLYTACGLAPGRHLSILRDVTEFRKTRLERERLLAQLQGEQQALRASEAQARLVIEAAPIGVMVADTSGRIRDVNNAWVEILGYTREEAISGQVNWREATPPEYRHLDLWAIEEVLRTGSHAPFEKQVVRKDGARVAVQATTAFLGGPEEIGVGFMVDLTERNRTEAALRESASWYRRLADSMPQIVWTARPDGLLDYYNARWFEYTGLSEQQTHAPDGWKPILHPDDVRHCHDTWNNSVRTGQPYQIEYRFRDHATGDYRWFLGRAEPARDADGNILKWFGTCTDIDEQKRAEMEIAALNARLRRSVQETHHRVKNNLQVISALVELQVQAENETVPAAALQRIGQHTRSLAAIHDILTQQAKTDPNVDVISTKAAMAKLIPLLQDTAGGRRILYEVEDLRLPVRLGASLALLVSETVSNAIKHGRGDIELTLTVREDQVCFRICDDGPGFPPDFDWRSAANTGLGLIDSAGRYDLRGDISYENRPEGGASVEVVFPLSAIQQD